MDFSFSDEQRAIAEMADGLFHDYCTDDRLRAWELSGEPYMAELWQTCIETGLHALAIPDRNIGGRQRQTGQHPDQQRAVSNDRPRDLPVGISGLISRLCSR